MHSPDKPRLSLPRGWREQMSKRFVGWMLDWAFILTLGFVLGALVGTFAEYLFQ